MQPLLLLTYVTSYYNLPQLTPPQRFSAANAQRLQHSYRIVRVVRPRHVKRDACRNLRTGFRIRGMRACCRLLPLHPRSSFPVTLPQPHPFTTLTPHHRYLLRLPPWTLAVHSRKLLRLLWLPVLPLLHHRLLPPPAGVSPLPLPLNYPVHPP